MKKDPIYISEKASHGGSIEIELALDFDISLSASENLFRIPDDLKGFSIVSAHAIWANLTGTLDGVVDLVQSHDDVNFVSTGSTSTLDSADGSGIVEKIDFSSKYAAVNFTKTGLTGGTLSIIFIAKRK